MKVLFAVNNESISESITKKYQQEYKEIISVKNVYYFNAIIKELQRDKTYDRIVVSEDLQPFSNNDYDSVDKFIFEKMDNISDEATNELGNDIPIILICTDRREKGQSLLVKLFGIGVYNALIGKDRSITNVCELLYRPRTKKEAKIYYRIDSDDVDYKVENEGDVSETEIQNILNHYKRLGKNEEKYVESFDHIASQYTDSQLKLIIKFLPLNVKAVLEANSTKYQQLVSFAPVFEENSQKTKNNEHTKKIKDNKSKAGLSKEELKLDSITNNAISNVKANSVIIPSAISTDKVKKVQPVQHIEEPILKPEKPQNTGVQEIDDMFEDINMVEEANIAATPKRRGRPRKIQPEEIIDDKMPKRGRGRPKKTIEAPEKNEIKENIVSNINSQFNDMEENDTIPGFEDEEENDVVLPRFDNIGEENDVLPGFENMEEDDNAQPLNLFDLGDDEVETTKNISNGEMILPGLDDDFEQEGEISTKFNKQADDTSIFNNYSTSNINNFENMNLEATNSNSDINMSNILTKDKKIVAFVGTSKNGTSFLVNNVTELLSQKGINTAILDLTKNQNDYYTYTDNQENLRKTAASCIENLKIGNAQGIMVHKNLTVYATLPGTTESLESYATILETLAKNYSLVILDCDFETNYNYFDKAQEIYLVQSLDVLTIQPLTAFLRNLKAKNVLNPEKLRVVLNKTVSLKSVNEKAIIGGMSYYNDPAMSFMTELFNKDTVKYCNIPFEEQTYAKYLDAIINCKITLNGYSKNFIRVLENLGDMVYPLISNNSKEKKYNNYNSNDNFSDSMNDTLNRMKNNY